MLVIMNNAMTVCMHVFVWTYAINSPEYIPRSGIARSYYNCLTFGGTGRFFPKQLYHLMFLLAMYEGPWYRFKRKCLHSAGKQNSKHFKGRSVAYTP